ncbi:hypothetical protein [Raineyella fluvialis]|uniref:Membrane protein YqaA, SNARE-associated domain n=1 Tax=Raineyella fluvialis TaxID=2662261 RepID=A0A5Q2FCG9_9ACTN|nr:hypothetical protein [Raineyella fluvialis]QGF24479.1 hypothetical protein Rai3103_13400 [Raineyella fluvialis]
MPELPHGLGWFAGFLVAAVYGLVGAVVPVANAEAYALAAGALQPAGSVAAIIGLTLGQGIGKMLMFWGMRRGKDLPFFHPRPVRPRSGAREAELGLLRRWWSRTIRVSLRLVGDTRAGLPLVFVAAIVGFPPLYPVVLVAGASPIPAWSFGLVMSLGRGIRFALLAWGGTSLAGWLG